MANQLPPNGYLLGLDVGDKRIGVALASVVARLPRPIHLIMADTSAFQNIQELIQKEDVTMVVIGIPRNLEGQETGQSQKIRDFSAGLAQNIEVPIVFADESLSSVRAEVLARQAHFKDVPQDSLAACFILEELLNTYHTKEPHEI